LQKNFGVITDSPKNKKMYPMIALGAIKIKWPFIIRGNNKAAASAIREIPKKILEAFLISSELQFWHFKD
jgi:hypothetical protein